MRMFRLQRLIQMGAAAAIAVAVGAGSLRAATGEPFVFEAGELDHFTVDVSEFSPQPGVGVREADAPITRHIPPQPADAADPALNLVPLPAPLAPAMVGISVVALRWALRRRRTSAARVFRRSR